MEKPGSFFLKFARKGAHKMPPRGEHLESGGRGDGTQTNCRKPRLAPRESIACKMTCSGKNFFNSPRNFAEPAAGINLVSDLPASTYTHEITQPARSNNPLCRHCPHDAYTRASVRAIRMRAPAREAACAQWASKTSKPGRFTNACAASACGLPELRRSISRAPRHALAVLSAARWPRCGFRRTRRRPATFRQPPEADRDPRRDFCRPTGRRRAAR